MSAFDEAAWFDHCLTDVRSSAEFAFVDLAGGPAAGGGHGSREIPLRIGRRVRAAEDPEPEAGGRDLDRPAIHDWHAGASAGGRGRLEAINSDSLLAEGGVWLIQGGAGAGKSMFLRAIARDQADRRVIALLVPASDFARWYSEEDGRTLLAYWAGRCAGRVLDRTTGVPAREEDRLRLQGLARRWLAEGKAFWILDGLDEVARVHRTQRLREHLANEAALPGVRLLLSSRYGGATDVFAVAPERELELLPLEQAESERFLEWHLGPQPGADLAQQLADDVTASRLVPNPLFLSLAALAYRDGGFTLPTGLGRLLDRAVGAMLRQGARGPIPPDLARDGVDAGRLRAVVEHLAWSWFTAAPGRDLERRDLLDRVEAAAKFAGCPDARREYLLGYLCETRLLNQRGDEMLQFVHLAIEEFLAACHLMDPRSGLPWKAWIHTQVWRKEWSLVVQVAASRIRERGQLDAFLDVLLDPSDLPRGHKDDVLAHRACSASAGLALVPPDIPGWQEAVGRVDRALLERLGGSGDGGGELWSAVLRTVDTPMPWHYSMVADGGLGHRMVGILQDPGADGDLRSAAAWRLHGTRDSGALAALVRVLRDPGAEQRQAAYLALRGTQDAGALAAAVQVLRDPAEGEDQRRAAVEALCGTQDGNAQAALGNVLRDPGAGEDQRRAACLALRGTQDSRALAALIQVLRGPAAGEDERWAAAWALHSTQDAGALAALVAAVGDRSAAPRVREEAADALEGTEAATAATALAAALRDPAEFEDVRLAAARALRGTKDDGVLKALVATLRDGNRILRLEAASALRGTRDAGTLDAMVAVLRDPAAGEDVNWDVAGALMGTLEAGVLAALVEALREPAEPDRVRRAAAKALAGTEDAGALAALAKALQDPAAGEDLRRTAAGALAGTRAAGALAALCSALRDPTASEDIREAAASALWRARDAGAQAALAAALRDPVETRAVRTRAARSLRGSRDRGALAALAGSLRDRGVPGGVRCEVAIALEGSSEAGAHAALAAAVRDPAEIVQVRGAAANSLRGTRHAVALAALAEVLQDPAVHNGVRLLAARSLRGTRDAAALAALVAVLREPAAEANLRQAVAGALEGTRGAAAQSALVEVLRDPAADKGVRQAAVRALKGVPEAGALAALAGALRDVDPDVRVAAAAGIRGQGVMVVWPDATCSPIELLAGPPPQPGPGPDHHLVFLVHGIRTPGHWVEPMSERLRGLGLQPINAGYGHFGLLPFLVPLVGRTRALTRVRRIVTDALLESPGRVSFVSHSFGCWIVSRLVRGDDFQRIKVQTWAQCGGVLLRGQDQRSERVAKIVNFCGTRDIWPGVARQFALGCGDSGTWGARSHPVIDVWMDADHSEVVKAAAVQDRLARTVAGESPSSDPSALHDGEPRHSAGVRLLSRLPAKIGLILAVALIALLLLRSSPLVR